MLCCVLVLEIKGQDEPVVNKGAIIGKPVVLPCGLSESKRVPPITWVDFVHNLDENPITIFDGTSVEVSHPKADRYSVGQDYSLTISNVSDTDPGEYVCRSKVGRTVNSASYIVLVAGMFTGRITVTAIDIKLPYPETIDEGCGLARNVIAYANYSNSQYVFNANVVCSIPPITNNLDQLILLFSEI